MFSYEPPVGERLWKIRIPVDFAKVIRCGSLGCHEESLKNGPIDSITRQIPYDDFR